MMRNIIYLSTFYPYSKYEDIHIGMRSAANISASAFSYSLFMGLSVNLPEKLFVVNTPPTGPFPISYNKLITKKNVSVEYGISVKSIGMNNLYGVQGLSICRRLYKELEEAGLGDVDILVYSIQLPLLQAAVKYKMCHNKSRIILVVPDLYEDINRNSRVNKWIKESLFGDYNELCKLVDAYILLTDLMIERMPYKRPYCVVEGIYNPTEKRLPCHIENNGFTIFYGGMLYERFGVKVLVDAVSSLDKSDVRLQLCGSGELEGYIKEKAKSDHRIEFLGIVPRENVLQLQTQASLLVNPRQPNGCFTRYSFPSKNIEYLASGTPTLIYELEGIPKEYLSYCYHLSARQISARNLCDMINTIYETPIATRERLAAKAQEFIFTKKSAPIQARRIIDFISSL